jgi:hypothetical protein
MRKSRIRAGLVVAVLALAMPIAASAEEGPWGLRVIQSVWANTTPLSPTYVTPKCLIPYPVCKLAIASVALVSSWEQLITGGDLQGAQETLGRGFGGPWFVQPKHVTGDLVWSLPAVPFPYYLATGETNAGAVTLDPLPSSESSPDSAGDVLPPL